MVTLPFFPSSAAPSSLFGAGFHVWGQRWGWPGTSPASPGRFGVTQVGKAASSRDSGGGGGISDQRASVTLLRVAPESPQDGYCDFHDIPSIDRCKPKRVALSAATQGQREDLRRVQFIARPPAEIGSAVKVPRPRPGGSGKSLPGQ